MSWTANTEPDLAGYHVYREGDNAPLAEVAAPDTSAVIGDLEPGQTYTFRMTAFDTWGNESGGSEPATVTLPDVPGAPEDVTAVGGYRQLLVTWTPRPAAEQVAHYVVHYTGNDSVAQAGRLDHGECSPEHCTLEINHQLQNNVTYEIVVHAVRSETGEPGLKSEPVYATPHNSGARLDPATISVGSGHTCAVSTAGSAYCWGRNHRGQLGDGTLTDRVIPTAVDTSTGLTDVASIDAGGWDATCALTTSGRVYCWGYNLGGGLGDNTTIDRRVPTPVDTTTGLSTVASIDMDTWATCAVTIHGKAWCWGHNDTGNVGDGTRTSRHAPVPVSTGTGLTSWNVAEISVGGTQTCAITTAAAAYCWGSNTYGQLGDGTNVRRLRPTKVRLTGVAAIAAGYEHSCAITVGGRAYCWGLNETGQLGDGGFGSRTGQWTPTAVSTSSGMTDSVAGIDADYRITCAITAAGRAFCWGDNAYSNLGDGTSTRRAVPTPVATDTGLPADGVSQVAVGSSHTCALTEDRRAFCWGLDSFGGAGTWYGSDTLSKPSLVDEPL